MIQLRPYQQNLKDGLYRSWQAGHRNVCLVSPTGSGKCLGYDTPILMANGDIKPVQDVVVGDTLASPTGGVRKVISLARGREKMYKVTPRKGDSYVVNASHLLSLKKTSVPYTVKLADGQRIPPSQTHVVIRADDFHASSKTARHVLKGWRSAVHHFSAPLPLLIPPYVVGAWIGDGTKRNGIVALAKPDGPVVQAWLSWGKSIGCDHSVDYDSSGCPTWKLTHPRWRHNPGLSLLRDIDAFDSWPNIPKYYRTASFADRAELLAGILDTDGAVSGGGWDFIAKHRQTSEDVAFVARSLGLAAYVSECTKGIKASGFAGTYYRVSISGDASIVPCRAKIPPLRKINKDPLVTGVIVEPAGEGDYYGFELDGDRLFMLGDFTVTHNTVVMASIASEQTTPGVAIAHRTELVGQISLAMARMGIEHNIIGSSSTVRFCIGQHVVELGRKFYNPNALVTVGSVDTIKARAKKLHQWSQQQTWWMVDESHHLLAGNKWGGAVEMMPRARGVGVTATPVRADRKSLHADQGGVFHDMIVGPSMRELINQGSLCDYRIFAPPQSITMSEEDIGASGDYKATSLRAKAHKSRVVGDVVGHYLKLARGLRGITFTVDVEQAVELAAAFNDAGVPAIAVSAKTNDTVRAEAIRKFREGKVLQLVNVDLFGEGFDVPAVEVVSMARPTMSYGLYVQQFGRALRTLQGKSHGIIIDHVGNVKMHGLPDAPREWTLYAPERGKRNKSEEKVTPVTACTVCFQAYEALRPTCPFCGHRPEPEGRSRPEQVDGDLIELDPATLAKMRGEVEATDARLTSPLIPDGVPPYVAQGIRNKARDRIEAQQRLRHSIALWAGLWRDRGDDDHAIYRRFFHRFGTDILTAQTFNRADADVLSERINGDMT